MSSTVDNPRQGPTPLTQQQQQRQQQVPTIDNDTTTFNNVVEDSSSRLTDIDLSEIAQELNMPLILDNSDIKRITARELTKPTLTTIENPDTFYTAIKNYMDQKIDTGDTSLTTTRMMNNLNQCIETRMSKILMTCFRHYNNEKLLENQKNYMTPQELEMAEKVITSIRSFREFIYH